MATRKASAYTARKMEEVEDQTCSAGGTHLLANDRSARTKCSKCKATWAELDAEIRTRLWPNRELTY